MKYDFKKSLIRGLLVSTVVALNLLMDYFNDLGYEIIIAALLRAYFIVSASVFIGIWNNKYEDRREKNHEEI